jgi:chromosome partitioning protein
MTASVSVVGASKGGVGKTTIACNLGIMSQLMGHKTLIVSLDPQRSSCMYIAKRFQYGLPAVDTEAFYFEGMPLKQAVPMLVDKLNKWRAEYDRIIFDVAGVNSPEFNAIMRYPHVTTHLMPHEPGDLCTEQIPVVYQTVQNALASNPELRSIAVPNKLNPHHKADDYAEIKAVYDDVFQDIGVSKCKIHQRVHIRYASSFGASVVEYYQLDKRNAKTACDELTKLYKEVFGETFRMKSVPTPNLNVEEMEAASA